MELSILCQTDIVLIMFGADGQLYEYSSSTDPKPVIQKYLNSAHQPHDRVTNLDVESFQFTF